MYQINGMIKLVDDAEYLVQAFNLKVDQFTTLPRTSNDLRRLVSALSISEFLTLFESAPRKCMCVLATTVAIRK